MIFYIIDIYDGGEVLAVIEGRDLIKVTMDLHWPVGHHNALVTPAEWDQRAGWGSPGPSPW